MAHLSGHDRSQLLLLPEAVDQPVGHMAQMATKMDLAPGDLAGARIQLVVASGAAVLALLMTTALSIYKLRGLTRYGWRRQHEGVGGLT